MTFNQEGKGEGVYWFEGEMSGFPEVKKGQQGRGYIVYPDKSTYEGEFTIRRKENGSVMGRHTEFLLYDVYGRERGR